MRMPFSPRRTKRPSEFQVRTPATYHLADYLLQCGFVLEPERIGLAQRLAHGGIAGRRALIHPK
jgi:hypothetical protein